MRYFKNSHQHIWNKVRLTWSFSSILILFPCNHNIHLMFYWKDTKSNKHQFSFPGLSPQGWAFRHNLTPFSVCRQHHWPDPSHPCLWAPLPTLLFKGSPHFKEHCVCGFYEPGTYTQTVSKSPRYPQVQIQSDWLQSMLFLLSVLEKRPSTGELTEPLTP